MRVGVAKLVGSSGDEVVASCERVQGLAMLQQHAKSKRIHPQDPSR